MVISTVRYQRRWPVAASRATRSRQPCDFANSASTTPSCRVASHSVALPRSYDQRSRPVAGSSPATRLAPVSITLGPSTGAVAAPVGAVHSCRTLAGSGAGSGATGASGAVRIVVVNASEWRTTGTATATTAAATTRPATAAEHGPGAHRPMVPADAG